jgi:maltose alpha-D-glucosyltransferase/alpha-amylase
VKKLISIRQENSALQSKGEIEFVYAEKNRYPLCYLRSDEKQKVLVIINPADREVSFPCEYIPSQKLYRIGGEVKTDSGIITVPPCFAGWYAV